MERFGNCRTMGNTALAYRNPEGEKHGAPLIDYDIARRSHEARKRLTLRQAELAACESQRKAPTLQETMLSTYRPDRRTFDMLVEAKPRVVTAVARHPFANELRRGTLRGKAKRRATDRQVLASGAVCMTLTVAAMLLGI